MTRLALVSPGRMAIAIVALMASSVGVLDAQVAPAPRPRIGVAFGGGSARGLAHVGVVRWLEEHHIPIDLVAGTSMGGLIGGGYAAGMSADELTGLLARTDWDEMFGFSSFAYKNVRRKEDARDYPSRIELGLKGGMTLPVALNNGQQVDFLLARIAGPYMTMTTFDDLPTPFRAIAVDLVTAQQVVLDRGSLATALRATMSLPGIFPPVEQDGRVLVDGGAMNNVPADVVRAMGADVVIAINVGFMGDNRAVSRSLLGLMSETIDVMMQATTRASLKSADIVINPPLEEFASLDWRRNAELAAAGYQAAEAARARLLPLAVSDTQWAAYQEQRRSRRKADWAVPAFVNVVGAAPSDRERIETLLAARVAQPLDVAGLEADLETLTGLDRYETVGWQMETGANGTGLRVEARPKTYAPPFLMLGVSLQNTTSNDFAFQLAGRYLAFDTVGSGSELRIDAAIGAQPRIGAELYYPIRSAFFVTGAAGLRLETVNFVSDEVVVARYSEDRNSIGFDVGVNLAHDSDVRLGFGYGHLDASVEAGDPELPELHGPESRTRLQWRHDSQDSPIVPSRGTHAVGTIERIIDTPALPPEFSTGRSNKGVTQAELRGSTFWSPGGRHRAFLSGGFGTSWGDPLATEQFELGTPFRLGAYDMGELRGDHYGLATLGYLRGVGRLPDFLGGPIFLGGWVENGSAFNELSAAKFRTNLSVGAVADTLVGPVLLGGSFDPNGAWRYYIGVGRLF